MYLSRLEIKNFRGIRSARIELGESTILIGENDSGKTSLLDAICLVLSPAPENEPLIFDADDFYKAGGFTGDPPLGDLRISLVFCERSPDEWSFMRNNEIGLLLNDDTGRLQELSIDVTASPPAGNEKSRARWRISVERRSRMEYTDDIAILGWIRGLNPVFRTRSGVPDYMQDLGADLHTKYLEALRSLGQVSRFFTSDGLPLDQVIYEILGRKPLPGGRSGKRVPVQHGSAAEKMGMLIFITAMLQSGSQMADPSAEPIIIIEDPEAHLHPMTLQAVKILIERLKWQKIITTQSGDMLSDFPLQDISRISRYAGTISQNQVKPGSLTSEDLRRLSYHVRMRMSTATFARCWLLVEGESEIWLLPHIARLCGYDLSMEGIVCVEFAQCGISPLIKAANQFGIGWFLLSDGDAAGKAYIDTARHFAGLLGDNPEDHCLRFRERDIEHHLFFNGYAAVYQDYAGVPAHHSQNMKAGRIIGRAIHRHSKPYMAVAIIEAISHNNSPGVPPELKRLVEKCVRLAKESAVGGRQSGV
jgi:putative ATP-dependent endonuclease of OLD family